jgi:MYXO-CTERM domain-containing protein
VTAWETASVSNGVPDAASSGLLLGLALAGLGLALRRHQTV